MSYLYIAFTVTWLIYFVYLFYLDSQLRSIRRRLSARNPIIEYQKLKRKSQNCGTP